jgi:ubiquinone/menaquinone biosynthesis C-methylase UbiE
MVEDESKDIESVRRMWDEHADTYDEWHETFEGAVQQYVDWQLLKRYLPEDRDAKILDAAGGTGRMTLPLAKTGYSVTLCALIFIVDLCYNPLFRYNEVMGGKKWETDVISSQRSLVQVQYCPFFYGVIFDF